MTVSRITAELPRESEYLSVGELQVQTGRRQWEFANVVLKELLDNALDAAEKAQAAPEITVGIGRTSSLWYITVADNGPGIPPEVVRKVLDFSVRVTDKAVYRSPARGAQGNALKTVVAIPFALGSCPGVDLPVVIESRDVRHLIRLNADAMGRVHVDHLKPAVATGGGTRVEVPVPAAGQYFWPEWWVEAFALFNPHARIKIGAPPLVAGLGSACLTAAAVSAEFLPTVDFRRWRKFLPVDPTSPWWYTEQDLRRLVYAYLNAIDQGAVKDPTLREFVRQFRGLSGSARAREVCKRLPGIPHLSGFKTRPQLIRVLLEAMQELTRPASPDVLGRCGGEHFRRRFEELYGVERFWYRREAVDIGGVPYVVEAAVAETLTPGDIFTGLNFSPTFEDPLLSTDLSAGEIHGLGIEDFCRQAGCHPVDPKSREGRRVAVAVHLVTPVVDFVERSKTRLAVPPEAGESYLRRAQEIAERALMALLHVPSLVAHALRAAGHPPDFQELYDWFAAQLSCNPAQSWRDLVEAKGRELAEQRLGGLDWSELVGRGQGGPGHLAGM